MENFFAGAVLTEVLRAGAGHQSAAFSFFH
jgi:hypothetical protein